MRREEAYYLARESQGGFTLTLSNFKGTGKSWDVSWNTTSAGTAATGSTLPTKRSHQPQTCTGAGGWCRGFPGGPSHPDIPAHLGAHFHLSPPAHSLPSHFPSPPASERHLQWVKANFNTLRHLAATCSLSICIISWICGSEHPWCQSTHHLPAACTIISSCPVKQGIVTVPLLRAIFMQERGCGCGDGLKPNLSIDTASISFTLH